MPDPKFILRFDDICDTVDPFKWNRIRETCIKCGVKPILAVIPANANTEFSDNSWIYDFWDQMKWLNGKGWEIALHGYNHVYLTDNSGIMGITKRSEFAGVSSNIQKQKICDGIKIFERNGLTPRVWVAPAHSFDLNTMTILREYGISIISDGLSDYPYTWRDFTWIPCQLWRFIIPPRSGIFTICIHIFKMSNSDIEDLCDSIDEIQA